MKDRHFAILKMLSENGRAGVNELSHALSISAVTIRKDLEELESQGMLCRKHGYAVKASTDAIEYRMTFRYQEKLNIARKAVSLVNPMETIMIESGSTCALFAKELAKVNDVTIITNSAYIARCLHGVTTAKVILLGGDYDTVSEVTTGPVTKLCAKEYFVDKIFVGIDGYTAKDGFSNINHTRCGTVRSMAKQAEKVIVLTTSEKFGKRGVSKMFSSIEVYMVVTDSELSDEYKQDLISHNILVEIADSI